MVMLANHGERSRLLAGSDEVSDRSHDRRRAGKISRGCTCSFRLELAGYQSLSRDSTCNYVLVVRVLLGKQAISWNFVRDTISLEYSMIQQHTGSRRMHNTNMDPLLPILRDSSLFT